ncbi:MAG: hypothetical protein KatS3mg091_389 [Patescibacteria group bacterium]|nr:MAG: hypothetical protein KatS3mg091_389 [Patescibacteria group bacterium]
MKIKFKIKNIIYIFLAVSLTTFMYYTIAVYEKNRIESEHKNANPSSYNQKEILVYKEPTCQCCGGWIAYLKQNGYKVKVETTTNIEQLKDRFNIPQNLRSCHTAVIANYIVEGHIPVPAIEKLLKEKPNVLGISLPGMPAGSPGMGGFKQEPFKIFSFTQDKTIEQFIEL